MFPVPWFVVVLYLVAYAVAGMAVDALTGWLASVLTRVGRKKLLNDAFFGAFGYLAGYIICALAPWPRNTVIEQLPGGGTVATTLNSYQHPERVAIVLAIFFPLLYELLRRKAQYCIGAINSRS